MSLLWEPDTLYEVRMHECDFCAAQASTTFNTGEAVQVADMQFSTVWRACSACSGLIAANNIEALVQRGCTSHLDIVSPVQSYPVLTELFRRVLASIHNEAQYIC